MTLGRAGRRTGHDSSTTITARQTTDVGELCRQPNHSAGPGHPPLGARWVVRRAVDLLPPLSPDGKSKRMLTSPSFDVYDFSKDGSLVYGIFHNTPGKGRSGNFMR
jgi:hypothetical protein